MYPPRSPYRGRGGFSSGRGLNPLARGKVVYRHPAEPPPPPGERPFIPTERREPELPRAPGPRRQYTPLQYHYDEDRGDWVLMGHDLYPVRRSIQMRANFFFAIAMFIEIAMLAWPVTAISIWGITNAVLTVAFILVHVPKIVILLWAIVSETHVYKMYGRRAYSFFWGLWTRRSHVRSNMALSIYGFMYGWIQLPVMLTYILLALTAYPLGLPMVLWWIQWPMGIVSLVAGYVAWCFIISEMAIRKNLEQYVAFGPDERLSVIDRMGPIRDVRRSSLH